MRYNILASIKGTTKYNEDVFGTNNNYFWVIDGATDLFECDKIIGVNVSEYVNLLSCKLNRLCNNKLTLNDIMKKAVLNVSEDLLKDVDIDDDLFNKLPNFAFVFCRVIDQKLEYLILGDCYLIIDNDIILTDNRISKFSDINKEKINAILKDNADTESLRLDIFRKTRLMGNKEDGYLIGTMDCNSISNAILGRIDNFSNIKLMTDGYFKFYEKYISFSEVVYYLFNDSEDLIYSKRDDATIIEVII